VRHAKVERELRRLGARNLELDRIGKGILGLLGDRLPGERIDRALSAGPAHRRGTVRVGDDRGERLGEVRDVLERLFSWKGNLDLFAYAHSARS